MTTHNAIIYNEPLLVEVGDSVTYRMMGFDTNVAVNKQVFWTSDIIDDTATFYTGSLGPVENIKVFKIIGDRNT